MPNYDLGTARGTIELNYKSDGPERAERDLGKLKRGAEETSASFDRAGNAVGIAGVAIAAGLGLAAKSAIDFEKQLSGIKAVSGATAQEMEKIREKALQIGKDTKFSASEAALAMEELVKAGVSTTDVMNGAADATVALAAAGEVDLPFAAEIAANALNVFGLSAQQMPRVADLIAGAANASAINVQEFGYSLQQAGAVADLAGVSFDDLAVSIALMGQAGIKGSDAGTSLKTFLSNLQPTTIKQIELFRELGLMTENGTNRFYDQTGALKSMADVAQILNDATSSMTAQQKQLTLELLFGSDAIRAAAIITEGGAAGFNTMAEAMGKVKAADVAAVRMDNLAGKIEQFKGSAETAAIQIGSVLLPYLTQFVNGISRLVGWFTDLDPAMQKAIILTAAIGGGTLLAVAAILKITAGIMQMVRTIKIMIPVIKAAALATKAFTTALLTNPIFLVIAAIVALVAGLVWLYKNNETARKIMDAVWNAIKIAIKATVDWIVNVAWPAIVAAWNAISDGAIWLWNILKAAWNGIMAAVNATVAGIQAAWRFLTKVWNGIAAGASFLWNIITTVFNGIKAVISTVVSVVATIISTYVKLWLAGFTGFINALKAIWDAFWGTFGGVIKAVFGLIVAIIKLALAVIELMIDVALLAIMTVWSTVWNAVKAVVTTVLDAIKTVISTAFDIIKSVISTALDFIIAYATTVWSAVWNVIKAVSDAIVNVVTTAWNAVVPPVVSAVNAIWGVISSIFNTIKSFITGAVNTITGALSNAWNTARNAVAGPFNEIKNTVTNAINAVVTTVMGLAGRILGAVSNFGSLLFNAGKNLIQGLIDGITNMIGKLTSKLNSITDMIPDVKGPESRDKKLLTPSGEWIMQSLITGISNEVPTMEALLGDITRNTIVRNATVSAAMASTAGQAVAASTSTSTSFETNFNLHGVDPESAESVAYRINRRFGRVLAAAGVPA